LKTRNLLLLVAILPAGCLCNTSPGDGEKVGTIVKLHKGGIFCDTYEAELIRGGMNGGSGSFGVQPFDFTIENKAQADTVRKYMEAGTEVRITYRREGIYSVCRSGDGAGDFLTSIVPAR
jgi:hypothetical protein